MHKYIRNIFSPMFLYELINKHELCTLSYRVELEVSLCETTTKTFMCPQPSPGPGAAQQQLPPLVRDERYANNVPCVPFPVPDTVEVQGEGGVGSQHLLGCVGNMLAVIIKGTSLKMYLI